MKTKPARAVFDALFDVIGLPAAVSVGLHLLLLLLVIHIIPASGGQSTPTPAQAPVIFAHMVAAPAPAAPAQPQAEKPVLSPVLHQPKQLQQAAQQAQKQVTRLASQTRPDLATQQKAEVQTQATLASATPLNTAQHTPKVENSSANALGHGAGSQIGSAPPASQAAPIQKARPNYAYNPPPDYPSLLQDEGIGGVVWMKVWVEVDGQPSQISVLRGSGYRMLDESARRAVQGWRFHPAKQGGQAFASWVEFPVRFNSQDV